MIIEQITIYLKDKKYLIYPSARTPSGLILGGPPYFTKPVNASAADISSIIAEALACSMKNTVPDPPKRQILDGIKNFLKFAGYKSYASLVKNCLLCTVTRTEAEFFITPMVKQNSRGVFSAPPNSRISLPLDALPSFIGPEVVKAFQFAAEVTPLKIDK
jgi:hypothetical protein